jgi:hypothetical protein
MNQPLLTTSDWPVSAFDGNGLREADQPVLGSDLRSLEHRLFFGTHRPSLIGILQMVGGRDGMFHAIIDAGLKRRFIGSDPPPGYPG